MSLLFHNYQSCGTAIYNSVSSKRKQPSRRSSLKIGCTIIKDKLLLIICLSRIVFKEDFKAKNQLVRSWDVNIGTNCFLSFNHLLEKPNIDYPSAGKSYNDGYL